MSQKTQKLLEFNQQPKPKNNTIDKLIFNIKVLFFFFFSRVLVFLSWITRKGSGTSLPGYYVEKWFPNILSFFSGKYKKVIYISGTNGKTTTRAVTNYVLDQYGFNVATNTGGANILRGLASTLLKDLKIGFNGILPVLKPGSEVLLLEVEEATLPKISRLLKCDILVLTNLFRDQLDAYGEIDTTLEYFINFLKLQPTIKVILNGDDGKLSALTNNKLLSHVIFKSCSVKTTNKMRYESQLTKIVDCDLVANNLKFKQGILSFDVLENFQINPISGLAQESKIVNTFTTEMSAVYNVYNMLFSIAIAKELRIKCEDNRLVKIIDRIKPVFGRGESFNINEKKVFLYLVKNPAGYDLVLDHLQMAFTNDKVSLAFLINDRIADSQDVSWLWDVSFESKALNWRDNNVSVTQLVTGGARGDDMALRLSYAFGEDIITKDTNKGSIDNVVDILNSDDKVWVVMATYTAMLEFRQSISRYVKVREINAKEGE